MKPIVVAELGLNHNGSIETAESLITMAKSFGADYVKFQKRTLEKVYYPEYLAKTKVTKFGKTVGDERRAYEFGKEQYDAIDAYCKETGIGWFASAWDEDSVEFLAAYKPPFLKIPSVGNTNLRLLDAARASGIPIIMSTGATTVGELCAIVPKMTPKHLLHCVALYPTPDERMNMARMETLNDWFPDTPIGLSTHSEKIVYVVQAYILGAQMLEFHVTLDRNMDGPDHASSIGPTGFDRIMKHLRSVEVGWGSPLIIPYPEEIEKRNHYAWAK